ncbi:MAG: ABC transporter permease [Eubacteriales bacterium]|nr:ABC transporter permease [Eubacteriales bacterium]
MAKNASADVAVKKTGKQLWNDIFNKFGIILILILISALMAVATQGLFLKPINLMNVFRQISFIGLIGIGVTVIIITTGIDLSSGSVLAMASVFAASFAHPIKDAAGQYIDNIAQYPLIVPIFIGLGVAALAGAINGSIIAYFELPPFIVTLGMMTAARGVAFLWTGGKPIGDFSDSFNYLGAGFFLGIPMPILLLLLATIFTWMILTKTKFGRHIYALGGNEQAAIISGVNVKLIKIVVYSYASLLAGVAGISLAGRIESGQPSAGLGFELDAIAAAVIGGTSQSTGGIGTVQGTIVGALIIGVINNGMTLLGVNSYWQQIVKAFIIVGAVLLDKKRNKS